MLKCRRAARSRDPAGQVWARDAAHSWPIENQALHRYSRPRRYVLWQTRETKLHANKATTLLPLLKFKVASSVRAYDWKCCLFFVIFLSFPPIISPPLLSLASRSLARGSPYWVWSCSRFIPVKKKIFFANDARLSVRLSVSAKQLKTMMVVRNAFIYLYIYIFF